MGEKRKIELVLEYQQYIEHPPIQPKSLYGNACQSDAITIESWRKLWIENTLANHKYFGSFKDKSLGKLYNINKNKPAIIIGAGPSLGYNGEHLKENKDILTVSCLHNYHYFVDREVKIDYYVSLDAGEVVLEEISEGGKKTAQEYWDSTKDKKLIAFIGSNPELFKKWQGEIYLFACPIPDQAYIEAVGGTEQFNVYVSNGGNVLGACLYIAKAFFGSNPIAFMGADFCFSHNTGEGRKFHSWNSKYDAKIGSVMFGSDVFGNRVLSWPSYRNFKCWFDWVSLQIPGIYYNCTEGGMLGAYPEGNIMSIRQSTLKDFLSMYNMNEVLRASCEDPTVHENRLLF